MFGLAVLAALMAMALVGTSSAMAEQTALCKEDKVLCPVASEVTTVHEVSVGKGKLLSSIATIECEVLFSGEVTSAGAPLKISGHFTYPPTGCETTSGTACEVKETSTSATIEVLKTAHELAEVKGTAEVNAHCGGLINCTYNGEGLLGHNLGPLLSSSENGNVNISEQTTNKTGGLFCPKTAKLDLTTTPLVKTYIAIPGKMVCLKVGPNKGFYLAEGNGGHCEASDAPLVTGEYELAEVARNQLVGEMACGVVGPNLGLLLAYNNGVACGALDGSYLGEYELGEIRN
jgi:hypothetical protein